MKHFFFLLFIFLMVKSEAQVTVTVKWLPHVPPVNSDTIYYNASRKLTWPDFKGTPGKPADALAITSSGLGYVATMQSLNGKTAIDINVYCYFSKQSSWVRPGKESDYALNHEQHHFDITYIITSLFIQKLKQAKFTRNNYGSEVEKIYKESCRNWRKCKMITMGKPKTVSLKIYRQRGMT